MIDDIDRQILALLQADARMSNAAIAEQVGLTTSTIHERVKKLERKGAIKGYFALVDAVMVDQPITAFIRLTVGSDGGNYKDAKQSINTLCQFEPNILECHAVAGEDCYVLKAKVASTDDLEKLIERLRCNAPISRSTTNIVLSTFKETMTVSTIK
jgi:Lrp/AsnC family leucine-responsive transcriptional regulator